MKAFRFLSCAILFSLMTINASAQKIHAIVFCNTTDPNIGSTCKVDHDQFTKTIGDIAFNIDYEAILTSRIGEECTKENLMSVIQNLNTTDKDIIFFYYSGHGAHAEGDNDYYPQMCLKYPASQQDKWVPSRIVNELLSNKPASMRIVMTDCCNNIASWVTPKTVSVLSKGMSKANEVDPELFKKLFVQTKGNIMVTSSKKGQTSGCNSDGGFFSIIFWEELSEVVNGKKAADWHSLMASVKKGTLEISGNKQEPYYNLNLSGSGAGSAASATTTPQPASTQVINHPQPAFVNPFASQSTLTDMLSSLINTNIDLNTRVLSIKNIVATYFSQDAKVAVVGRDMKTIVDYVPVADFLRNITMAGNIQLVNIIEQTTNGYKINYLKVHEVIK